MRLGASGTLREYRTAVPPRFVAIVNVFVISIFISLF